MWKLQAKKKIDLHWRSNSCLALIKITQEICLLCFFLSIAVAASAILSPFFCWCDFTFQNLKHTHTHTVCYGCRRREVLIRKDLISQQKKINPLNESDLFYRLFHFFPIIDLIRAMWNLIFFIFVSDAALSLSLHGTGQCHTISFYYIINTVESRFVSLFSSSFSAMLSDFALICDCIQLFKKRILFDQCKPLVGSLFLFNVRSLARSFPLFEYILTVKFLQFLFFSLKCDRDWNLCVMLSSFRYTLSHAHIHKIGIASRWYFISFQRSFTRTN